MPILAPAQGPPAGPAWAIEFVAGVWTDVTADVQGDPVTIKYGRTSEFSAPVVASLTGLKLKNTLGTYTPLCQVLVDGTPNPYWPNIQPRRRIRYSNTPAGTRFTGFIQGWPPYVDENGLAWVVISATDRDDQLSRIDLLTPILQEQANSVPALSWACGDLAGAAAAVEGAAGPGLAVVPGGAAVVFGGTGPDAAGGDGTSVAFAPGSSSSGQYLQAKLAAPLAAGAFTFEVWVNAGSVLPAWATGAGTEIILGFDDGLGNIAGIVYLLGGVPSYEDVLHAFNAVTSIADGAWHHLAVSRSTSGGAVSLYVDGVLAGSTASSPAVTAISVVTVGESANPNTFAPERFQGSVAHVGVYTSFMGISTAAAHAAATNGYTGDTTDTRIARWLTAGGLTAANWNLDTGHAVVGTYPQAGQDVVSACQAMAVTEGGGSVVYVTPDGKERFVNRWGRKAAAPVMTLDAEADLDGTGYAPSFDELTLVNSSTVTRSNAAGTLSVQTKTDPVSSAPPPVGYGLATDTATSYASTDLDALCLAQSRVAANAYPGFRLPQITVDMLTAEHSLYAALANIQIGSRIRVTNLPPAKSPTTQVDVIVEGWTETVGTEQYQVVFDTSPADNPAGGIYDDTVYGRYGCSGQTLNASITNSATTLAIATTAGLPTFTVAAGQYPMNILVGQEVITLTSVPGGSSSPQTFTGVTRGVAGTPAAAQASGAVIALYPAPTYCL
jgi:hypothetical protein